MLRSLVLFVGLVVVAAGCSTPSGASSSWSFGPSLPAGSPGASGAASAVPSVAASASASAAPSPTASATDSPGASAGQTVEVTIGTKINDELEFDPDSATVTSGALVKLTFENRAKTLPHNLTFQEPINAATPPVVGPGTSATVEFTAPAPGNYTWMCTIHPVMKGTLEVTAAAS